MKVVLAAPPWAVKGMDQAMCSPPLGLLYLAGAAEGHDISITDLKTTPKSPERFARDLEGADMFGMTIMTSGLKFAKPYLKKAKAMGIKTVVGGYHPSLCPDIVKNPEIDLVVRGEAEVTFKQLCDGLPLKDIKGITFKNNGSIINNPPQPLIKNLDDLPMPRRDLLDMSKYQYLFQPADVIESTRGCPYQCNFCCITNFYGNSYRMKSAGRVVKEIAQIDRKKRLIFFVDDNFAQNMRRVDNICNQIKAEGHDHFLYAGQARVDSICKHPDIVENMADAGFICLFLGIESIHQKSLTAMGKKTKSEQIKRAIDILHDRGMIAYGSFIVGNIGETRDDIIATSEFMRDSGLDVMQATPLTPYPGTPLYEKAVENGWVEPNWWENWDLHAAMDTPDLNREEIYEMFKYTMRRFYYNFKWYTSMKKWKNIFQENMSWWWKIAPKFFTKGAVHFIFKLGS